MKQFFVFSLFFLSFFYYILGFYQDKKDLNNQIKSKKQALLSQDNKAELRSDKKQTLSFISQASAHKQVKEVQKEVPKNHDLDVQFFPQSPFGKWGPIFGEACEEASALIAINYIRGITMTRTEFRDTLLDMVDYENETFGDYVHTNVDQTSQMLEEFFGFKNYTILEEPGIQDIKRELSNGNIIIAPFYGVGMNPNFTGKGPNYHFIVIKGYTEDSFITHEVGTKNGEDYKYSQNDIMNRLHDYHKTSILKGKKRLIVLKK